MTSAPAFAWRSLGLVVLGGALGAMARAALMWPAAFDTGFAVAVTAATNVVGALGLGIVVGVTGAKHPSARAFLGTGVLGGFTTFSLFAAQVATSTPWLGVVLGLGTMALGVVAAGLGLRIGRGLGRRRYEVDAPEEAE